MTEQAQLSLHDQADALYQQYGTPLELNHWGEYVVISPEGKTVVLPSLIAAAQEAAARLGRGNFAFRIGERAVASWK